jgi:hypothetical protein
MQQAVRKYLTALEAGDAEKAALLFTADGWVSIRLQVESHRSYLYTTRISSAVSSTRSIRDTHGQ